MENKEKKVIEKLLKKLNTDKENLISTTKDNVEGLIINYREDAKAYTNYLVTIDTQDVELGDYLVNLCDSYKNMLSDCKNVISFYKEDDNLYNSLVVDIVDIYGDYIATLKLAHKYAKANNNEKFVKSYEHKIEKIYLEQISYYTKNQKDLNNTIVREKLISLITDLATFEESKKVQSYTDMINKLSSKDELDKKTVKNLKHYSFTKGKKYALVGGIAATIIVVAICASSCKNNKKTDTNAKTNNQTIESNNKTNTTRSNVTANSNGNLNSAVANDEEDTNAILNDESIMALIEEKQDKDEISYDEFMETYKNVCSKYFLTDQIQDMDSILTVLYYMNAEKLSNDALVKLEQEGKVLEPEKLILSNITALNVILNNNMQNISTGENMINVSDFTTNENVKKETEYLESLVNLIANGNENEALEAYKRIGDTFILGIDEGYNQLEECAKFELKQLVLLPANVLAGVRGINYNIDYVTEDKTIKNANDIIDYMLSEEKNINPVAVGCNMKTSQINTDDLKEIAFTRQFTKSIKNA